MLIHRALSFSFITYAAVFGSFAAAQTPDLLEALPEHLIYLYTADSQVGPDGAQSQLYSGQRLWEKQRVLRVCLFGGNEVVAALIRNSAMEWNEYSSVKLDFGPSGTWQNCVAPHVGFYEIRVGFSERGFWSAVGRDSEARLDTYSPTMNFESFNRLYAPNRSTVETIMSDAQPYHVATIKHEFGHALGLLHEHQNPALKCFNEIKWSGGGNVYEVLGGPPNNWSEEQVRRNLGFIGQTDPDYVSQAPDPQSIMMYSLPAGVFLKGNSSPCFVAVNYSISKKDREIISKIYDARTATNLPATNDSDLKSAQFRPLSAAASPAEVSDLKQKIFVDLESNDTFTRRNARARLADLLTKLTEAETTDLIRSIAQSSYRVQLGVAVAIAKAPFGVRLSSEAKAAILNRARTAIDPTLRREFSAAAGRKT